MGCFISAVVRGGVGEWRRYGVRWCVFLSLGFCLLRAVCSCFGIGIAR